MSNAEEIPVAHMTASAWVVNKDRSPRVLMVYHNVYNSGPGWEVTLTERDLLKVAIREVKEGSRYFQCMASI